MAWPYAFLDLSDAQKPQRRQLLDWYGSAAQLSVVFPLLALQAYFLVVRIQTRRKDANGIEEPSSPRVKEAKATVGPWRRRWTQAGWWMDGEVMLGGDVVGTRGQVVGAVAWIVWLGYLSFAQTGQGGKQDRKCLNQETTLITSSDYLHLTKRFGTVAASQLPFHYLLALKTPYSPIQYLTRRSHESLNALHQLLGRTITFLLYAHAALYMNFYVQKDLVASKLQEAYVICGIVGVTAFTAVGTTALSPVRRWSYRIFYITHVVLASLLLPVLWFHVSHIRIYLYETVAVYALNVVLRSLSSKTVPASIRLLEGESLVETSIPLISAGPHKRVLQQYQPGQHAYLSLPGHPASRTFRSNPFSVASCPSVDHSLRFVARMLDGNTASLASAARLSSGTHQSVTIEGPYGVTTHAEKLLQCDRVLFVAGGIGGTFVAPLYRQLLADLSPSAGSYRRQKVSFVWVVRDMGDMSWSVPQDEGERAGFTERLQLWVTRASGRDLSDGGLEMRSRSMDAEEGIELQESRGLLSEASSATKEGVMMSGLNANQGRPDLERLVDESFSHGTHEKVGVVVCGPRSLSRAARDRVGTWVRRGREVWFWDESFSF